MSRGMEDAQSPGDAFMGIAGPGAAAPPYPLASLYGALAKAQAKVKGAAKISDNPQFKSKYADLAAVWEACRAALAENGLCVIQIPHTADGKVGCETILGHASGQEMRSPIIWTTPRDAGPQAFGSCTTYLRRYQLSAMVGVAPDDDDDGNAGSGGGPASPKGEAGGKPAPAPRANTVTHTGKLATREQVDQLLDLRRQVGGLTVCEVDKPCPYPNGTACGYHKQLGAFKDASGTPVRDADKLASEQIENLIGRYKAKIAQQGARAAEPPDVGAIGGVSPGTVQTLRGHLAKKTQTEEEFQFAEKELCAVFGVDSITELNESQSGSALALVLAFQTDKWTDVLARVREKEAG